MSDATAATSGPSRPDNRTMVQKLCDVADTTFEMFVEDPGEYSDQERLEVINRLYELQKIVRSAASGDGLFLALGEQVALRRTTQHLTQDASVAVITAQHAKIRQLQADDRLDSVRLHADKMRLYDALLNAVAMLETIDADKNNPASCSASLTAAIDECRAALSARTASTVAEKGATDDPS